MGIFWCCQNKKKVKGKKKEDDITKPRGVYAFSKDGQKKEQDLTGQDFYHMYGFEIESSHIRFIGVYDGHGDRGKEASNFIGNFIGNYVVNNKNVIKKWNTKDIVTTKFSELFKSIQKKTSKNKDIYEYSGSCATSVLVIDKFCFVINLGDSRAVIGSKNLDIKFAIQMSSDHKPNVFEEQERIVKMGGEVSNNKDGYYGPYRVYKNNGDNTPGLAISRSLGDLVAHECGVSEIPQISFKIIDSQDEFIVIGSDGIWDVMNSVEIVGYVFERIDEVTAERISEEIVEECRKRWNLINKFKEEAIIEKLLSDSSINASTKSYIQNMKQQQQLNTQTGTLNTSQSGPATSITGQTHNIDDITCVILFFKS
jgi:serine/threonine protein phosphatase PrpC